MAKHSRLILTRDGERSFGRLADGIARALDRVLRTERIRKKELAERAGVDQAVISRVLDGSRNLEIRTIGAIFGAAGYVLEVVPRPIHAVAGNRQAPAAPQFETLPVEDQQATVSTVPLGRAELPQLQMGYRDA